MMKNMDDVASAMDEVIRLRDILGENQDQIGLCEAIEFHLRCKSKVCPQSFFYTKSKELFLKHDLVTVDRQFLAEMADAMKHLLMRLHESFDARDMESQIKGVAEELLQALGRVPESDEIGRGDFHDEPADAYADSGVDRMCWRDGPCK